MYQQQLYNVKDLRETKYDTFIKIEKQCISALFDLDFKELCFWQLCYDISNFNSAKIRATQLYEQGQLPGIQFISYPIIATDETKLLFFSGPIFDEQFMTFVGNLIVFKMNHMRQNCNKSYSSYIYCLRKGERYKIKVPF